MSTEENKILSDFYHDNWHFTFNALSVTNFIMMSSYIEQSGSKSTLSIKENAINHTACLMAILIELDGIRVEEVNQKKSLKLDRALLQSIFKDSPRSVQELLHNFVDYQGSLSGLGKLTAPI